MANHCVEDEDGNDMRVLGRGVPPSGLVSLPPEAKNTPNDLSLTIKLNSSELDRLRDCLTDLGYQSSDEVLKLALSQDADLLAGVLKWGGGDTEVGDSFYEKIEKGHYPFLKDYKRS